MRKQLCLLALYWPLLAMTQTANENRNGGIKWIIGLNWEQVRQKAKTENKYIFLDCFATWCGPCKAMDKNVYASDSVGQFFNEKFIAVKVQMDKTKLDIKDVKQWYSDAEEIKKQYHVEGYPTFLFFAPDGRIVDKQYGFKHVTEFIAIGLSAMKPEKVYDDPYADYTFEIAAYKQGIKDYNKFPSMIKIADKLHDTAFSRKLSNELIDYVSDLSHEKRYTKERIEFWANYTWLSNTRVFSFFYNDARLINKVMNRKGYAESFIDKTIQFEIAMPFLKEQAKGSPISMEGAYLNGPGLKADFSEADWNQLDRMIRTKYGKTYAVRNVLTARVEWYRRHRNTTGVIKYYLIRIDRFSPDVSDWGTTAMINGSAWDAFLTSNNKRILRGYSKWMKKVIQNYPNKDNYIDTYANLLYKNGHKQEAIEWEEKAVKLAPKDESLLVTLEQMKKGEPTYINQGAIWEVN